MYASNMKLAGMVVMLNILAVSGKEAAVPNQAPSAVGASAVEGFYTGTFKAVAFTLKFQVSEVKILGPEWAMLRSTSAGTMKILANGAMVPSANQELFVLHKESGKWKFARYSLSSTLPSAQ